MKCFGPVLLAVLVCASLARAEDEYLSIGLDKLEQLEGELPKGAYESGWNVVRRAPAPRVAFDNGVEGYLSRFDWERRNMLKGAGIGALRLTVRVEEGAPVTGLLFVPDRDWKRQLRVRFRLDREKAESIAEGDFLAAKAAHYRQLLDEGVAGAAWFRRKLHDAARSPDLRQRFRRGTERDIHDTFAMFSGGRAVAENLQLDRAIPVPEQGDVKQPRVAVDAIRGITVAEMDWAPYLEGATPVTDPLAGMIPADQYAVYFPTFQALVDLTDAADAHGSPLLFMTETRAEDALTRARYERQLCVGLNALTRLIGPKVIRSVVFTGSDPYLRTGSDIALLFEAEDPKALRMLIAARIGDASEGVKPTAGKITGVMGDVEYSAVVTPDRVKSSYLALVGDTVVLTNSLAQLERIALTARDELESMAGLDEYKFFRSRYPRGQGEETALLLLTDAAIRKWCGPRWRIAASRRVRAAARLADEHARHFEALISGTEQELKLADQPAGAVDMGRVLLAKSGARSSIYNTLDFQTPISELRFSTVTAEERRFYERWRDGYQSNWSGFFDPIAVRLFVSDDKLSADVTVMPLIGDSEYKQFTGFSRGGEIKAEAGDRHPGRLAHFALAIDKESWAFKGLAGWMQPIALKAGGHPFDWLGDSVSLSVEPDAFWDDLQEAEDQEKFWRENVWRLPVAIRAEVVKPLRLTVFLTAMRSFIEQAAPGMTLWETRTYKEQPYVRISPAEAVRGEDPELMEKLGIHYLVTPEGLTLSLSEDLIKRAIDRRIARKSAKEKGEPMPDMGAPILGKHLAAQVDLTLPQALAIVRGGDMDFARYVQKVSWSNLHILNEYKRLWPARDPVKLHEQVWGVRLVCPGGGQYVWNDEWQTMESTVYGHPGQPRGNANAVIPFKGWKRANFGLEFEQEGLRATGELTRH